MMTILSLSLHFIFSGFIGAFFSLVKFNPNMTNSTTCSQNNVYLIFASTFFFHQQSPLIGTLFSAIHQLLANDPHELIELLLVAHHDLEPDLQSSRRARCQQPDGQLGRGGVILQRSQNRHRRHLCLVLPPPSMNRAVVRSQLRHQLTREIGYRREDAVGAETVILHRFQFPPDRDVVADALRKGPRYSSAMADDAPFPDAS